MNVALREPEVEWTAADILKRFGPIPLSRIRMDPSPGTATEADVLEILDREGRLCELVDGVLIEKTVGFDESFWAVRIARILATFVDDHGLGIVTGADGTIKLAPGLIRIPDVAYFSWARLPGRKRPRNPFRACRPTSRSKC